ncbi:MAG: hypothetical protein M3R41_08490 [Pseudomonadota bacterium]|nr:hypothetical protein [Pseudomonadota bacterium]
MKILNAIAAAGLLLSTASIATAADAQNYGGDHHQYDRDHRGDRDRDYRRDDRRDNGHRYGWRHSRHYGWNDHRRCWTQWRHHRQVRVCR